MRILLLGAGGREHALAWKLTQSPSCSQLFIAPGNAGTALCGTNISISLNDFEKIKAACISENINMVIVGPEDPLVNGIVNYLQQEPALEELHIIGPSREAAMLEGSKAFAKVFMQKNNIPTAAYKEFTIDNYADGVRYLQQHSLPVVLKADGLASGKGVVICQNHLEAVAEFELMIQRAKFGEAGKRVVVEAFLDGIELSVFVLTDGNGYVILPEAKDYKKVGEGDTGLNTGGMGAVSPVSFADKSFMQKVEQQIIKPTIQGLKDDNLKYHGFVFIGLMKVGDDPFVIEYNCRMGDPETEVVMPRLKNDLALLMKATAEGKLHTVQIETDKRFACTIMAVSGGYPNEHATGFEITGLEDLYDDHSLVFYAAVKKENDQLYTNGGRIFCITSFGETVAEASGRSKEKLAGVHFNGMYYRGDIGFEFT
ncbi:MAG: phosphoribosylamine--glycine ligase [Chitinophagaceae bacterium]|jgi:phosphoribosylamine--glycine ligase|nr:phosphoribosylamine--glycine ligase [Chitinophagaceae bacterium]